MHSNCFCQIAYSLGIETKTLMWLALYAVKNAQSQFQYSLLLACCYAKDLRTKQQAYTNTVKKAHLIRWNYLLWHCWHHAICLELQELSHY